MVSKVSVLNAKRRAWTAFSKYVRARDEKKGCYTCSTGRAEHAGHYHHNTDKVNKVLGGNELWYDERNAHGQCMPCNNFNSGRRDIYAVRLVEEYGPKIIPTLYALFIKRKVWTIEELLAIEEKYVRKLSEL